VVGSDEPGNARRVRRCTGSGHLGLGRERDLAREAFLEWGIGNRRRGAPHHVAWAIVECQVSYGASGFGEELLLIGEVILVELVGVAIDAAYDNRPVDLAQRVEHRLVALGPL
jgi:hypothetical protein